MCLDVQQIRLQTKTYAAVLFVRQDRGALECLTKRFAAYEHELVVPVGNHSMIIGKTAIDQFRGEAQTVESKLDVVRAEANRHFAFVIRNQAAQLSYCLARNDNGVLTTAQCRLQAGYGESMPVGCNRRDVFSSDLKQ